MANYIVTDLTRFSRQDIVCTAVVDLSTGECLRPMPYFEYERVRALGMTPGAIISGSIARTAGATTPHLEDANYEGLRYIGPASASAFRDALIRTRSACIRSGFSFAFPGGQRYLPTGQSAPCSIITIQVDPACIRVVPNAYEPAKIKLQITDASGYNVYNLPITDLGFHEFAKHHHERGDLEMLNRHIEGSQEIFVRIGLGRRYCPPNTTNDGCWMQANGIYTFPSKLGVVRGYSE